MADAPASPVDIASADGATARVHLDGGHVTSWSPAGTDDDLLFVSRNSGFGPGVSIRGGIPVCFPQFGGEGALPQHGFARTSRWTLLHAEDGGADAHAVLRLEDDERTRALWPHAFHADLTVHVAGATLDVSLAVTNSGDVPFTFTAALHPYFRTRDAYRCQVQGLRGMRYRDALRERAMLDEAAQALMIDGEIDRVYFDVPWPLRLVDGERTVRIEARGFPDAVVWNPGEAGVARKADFLPGDERRMLCVEAGAIGAPVTLGPGERWEGAQRATVE